MSGMTSVNRAAAESVAGLDAASVEALAAGLGLIHILQVYTSSMVCPWKRRVCATAANQPGIAGCSRCLGLVDMLKEWVILYPLQSFHALRGRPQGNGSSSGNGSGR